MKICANSKIYDVQEDQVHGIVVQLNGRTLFPETRGHQVAVAEYKRAKEDAGYAAREAKVRA